MPRDTQELNNSASAYDVDESDISALFPDLHETYDGPDLNIARVQLLQDTKFVNNYLNRIYKTLAENGWDIENSQAVEGAHTQITAGKLVQIMNSVASMIGERSSIPGITKGEQTHLLYNLNSFAQHCNYHLVGLSTHADNLFNRYRFNEHKEELKKQKEYQAELKAFSEARNATPEERAQKLQDILGSQIDGEQMDSSELIETIAPSVSSRCVRARLDFTPHNPEYITPSSTENISTKLNTALYPQGKMSEMVHSLEADNDGNPVKSFTSSHTGQSVSVKRDKFNIRAELDIGNTREIIWQIDRVRADGRSLDRKNIEFDDLHISGRTFKARGFICHRGQSPFSGHYVAYVQENDGEWYEYNDSVRSHIKSSDIDKFKKQASSVQYVDTNVPLPGKQEGIRNVGNSCWANASMVLMSNSVQNSQAVFIPPSVKNSKWYKDSKAVDSVNKQAQTSSSSKKTRIDKKQSANPTSKNYKENRVFRDEDRDPHSSRRAQAKQDRVGIKESDVRRKLGTETSEKKYDEKHRQSRNDSSIASPVASSNSSSNSPVAKRSRPLQDSPLDSSRQVEAGIGEAKRRQEYTSRKSEAVKSTQVQAGQGSAKVTEDKVRRKLGTETSEKKYDEKHLQSRNDSSIASPVASSNSSSNSSVAKRSRPLQDSPLDSSRQVEAGIGEAKRRQEYTSRKSEAVKSTQVQAGQGRVGIKESDVRRKLGTETSEKKYDEKHRQSRNDSSIASPVASSNSSSNSPVASTSSSQDLSPHSNKQVQVKQDEAEKKKQDKVVMQLGTTKAKENYNAKNNRSISTSSSASSINPLQSRPVPHLQSIQSDRDDSVDDSAGDNSTENSLADTVSIEKNKSWLEVLGFLFNICTLFLFAKKKASESFTDLNTSSSSRTTEPATTASRSIDRSASEEVATSKDSVSEAKDSSKQKASTSKDSVSEAKDSSKQKASTSKDSVSEAKDSSKQKASTSKDSVSEAKDSSKKKSGNLKIGTIRPTKTFFYKVKRKASAVFDFFLRRNKKLRIYTSDWTKEPDEIDQEQKAMQEVQESVTAAKIQSQENKISRSAESNGAMSKIQDNSSKTDRVQRVSHGAPVASQSNYQSATQRILSDKRSDANKDHRDTVNDNRQKGGETAFIR